MRLVIRGACAVCVGSLLLLTSNNNAAGQTSGVRVASGLAAPTFATAPVGDTNRLFFLEQGSGTTARIRVMDLTTQSVATFLTVSGVTTGGERGLLGLAFDPNYASNGYFYTYSSHPSTIGGNHQSEVRRWSVTGDPATSNVANMGSAFSVMRFAQPFSNHNGGWLGFDPTSTNPYLYIATGDGGSGGDPQNNAQDITNNRLGKMLRIDVTGDAFPASPTENYSIPPSNPFVGTTGDDEIWAYGLRNPWRNSFDRETGDLWIGDVGQNIREEIDFQPASSQGGENYGWRVMEGLGCFDNSQAGGNPPCNDPSLTAPVYQYTHGNGNFQGISVSGGYVYRGSVDQYEGLYVFADYGSNNIWTIDPLAANPAATVLRRNTELPPSAGSYSGIASFGEDGNGELYIVSVNNGSVHRISTTSTDAVWNGSDASAGAPGDGMTWDDANNWTRGGVVDQGFSAKDTVVFPAAATADTVDMGGNRTVGAMDFQATRILTSSTPATMTVLSGNVHVAAGETAQFESGTSLMAETANASVRKRGNGTLNVKGTATHVRVLEGTLGGSGNIGRIDVHAGARVAPGYLAPFTVAQVLTTSHYAQQAGSTLEIELRAASHDQLVVSGTSGIADLAGKLEVVTLDYTDPTTPGTVDAFVAVMASSIVGNFDEVTYDGTALPASGADPVHVGAGLFRGYTTSNTEVTVFNYKALAGDADGDGVVDGNDFIIWNANKFTSGTDWLTGDFDGDGFTDGNDFILWNANKFSSVTLPRAVPEPTGIAGLLIASIAFMRRRSR